jgi:hypothetical protein
VVFLSETGFNLAVKASICPPIMATPFPGLYFPPTVKAMIAEPFLETKYFPEAVMRSDQSSRSDS